jgi:hypothetical protein
MKDIAANARGAGQVVTWRQDALTKLGKNIPVKDARIRVETEYSLQPGAITRTDRYIPQGPLDVSKLTLDFASFSNGATVEGNTVRFKEGAVQSFEVGGLASCTAQPTGSELYRAPYGQMNTIVRCSSGAFSLREPLVVRWTIRYQ